MEENTSYDGFLFIFHHIGNLLLDRCIKPIYVVYLFTHMTDLSISCALLLRLKSGWQGESCASESGKDGVIPMVSSFLQAHKISFYLLFSTMVYDLFHMVFSMLVGNF